MGTSQRTTLWKCSKMYIKSEIKLWTTIISSPRVFYEYIWSFSLMDLLLWQVYESSDFLYVHNDKKILQYIVMYTSITVS